MNRTSRHLRSLFVVATLVILSWLSGCASYVAPVKPPQGVLVTHVKAPLSTNFDRTPCGTEVTKSETTSGVIYVHDVLLTGLSYSFGDAMVEKAAYEGGIEEIAFADYELTSILGIVAFFKVTVHGN